MYLWTQSLSKPKSNGHEMSDDFLVFNTFLNVSMVLFHDILLFYYFKSNQITDDIIDYVFRNE